ncbi:MAG: ROK family protein, partial [Desulfuromonadales bacterium]|nr:ROK family protein [Desulfuromonadales bacterium]
MNFLSDNILVYDIGGTKLRGAIYSLRTKAITAKVVKPTPNRILCPTLSAEELYTQTLNCIRTISNELLKHEPVSAVTVAFPGPVDRQGRVIAAPGIWGRNPSGPIDMLADLQTIWPQMPVHIANDLTAAGYRYLERKTESFCILTVSTGIGSKIFIKGEPQLGADGTGGEIGHAKVLLAEDAPLCDCGEPGHLQA